VLEKVLRRCDSGTRSRNSGRCSYAGRGGGTSVLLSCFHTKCHYPGWDNDLGVRRNHDGLGCLPTHKYYT
jgi:hypothetical protein